MLHRIRHSLGSISLLVLLTALVPFQSVAGSAPLLVEKPHVMLPPPGAQVAAGFMSLVNPGDTDIIVTGATSERFERIEIHLSVVENDVAKMLRQSELVIPAGGSIELKHGSYHLMLMGAITPLEAGQEIPLMLQTTTGSVHVVLNVVKKMKHIH